MNYLLLDNQDPFEANGFELRDALYSRHQETLVE